MQGLPLMIFDGATVIQPVSLVRKLLLLYKYIEFHVFPPLAKRLLTAVIIVFNLEYTKRSSRKEVL